MFHLSVFHQPCSASNTETQHSNRSSPGTNDIKTVAFWDDMPCMLLCSYQYFGGKAMLPSSGSSYVMKMEATGSSKMLVTFTKLDGVTSEKTVAFIYITGRTTSNATQMTIRNLMILLQKETSQCFAHCNNLQMRRVCCIINFKFA
jgi:hypothetical protein